MDSGKEDPKILYQKERTASIDFNEYVLIENPIDDPNDSYTE